MKSHITSTQFSSAYRNRLLTLLIAVNLLNMADRQGLAAIAPAIKADLRLTDTELGLIQGLGFAIFYSIMGLPLARLSESRNRIRIVAGCVAIFGAMAALCGFARNFTQLLVCRIGVAIGDAGFGPPVSSLLGDHFPASRRTSIMTIIWLGAPVGAVIGSAVGGFVAQAYGWRLWFYIMAVPAAAVALAILFTLREPQRGLQDQAPVEGGSPPSLREALAFLWSKRSMRHILIGAAMGAIALNGVGQFLARFFVLGMGMSVQEAGGTMGVLSLCAMTSGFALGGFGMDRAARRNRAWYVRGPALALAASAPLLIAGFAQHDVAPAIILLLVGQVALFIFFTPTLALAQNMVDARMRATSAFVVSLVVGLLGTGLGPTITGFLSDFFSAAHFPGGGYARACMAATGPQTSGACAAAANGGLRHALMTVSLFALWASFHYWAAGRSLAQDLVRQYRPSQSAQTS